MKEALLVLTSTVIALQAMEAGKPWLAAGWGVAAVIWSRVAWLAFSVWRLRRKRLGGHHG